MRYRDTIELSEELGVVHEAPNKFFPKHTTSWKPTTPADHIEEYLREVGQVERDGLRLTFEIEVDGDLWDLRERVEEVEIELTSRGHYYTADRSHVVE